MLPSVRERKKNAQFFHQAYTDICRLRNVIPIPAVQIRADKNILDICGDKLKVEEWIPIIEALKQDRSLHFIAIHSKYNSGNVLEEIDADFKARANKKCPPLFTRFVMKLLLESIAFCVSESKSVTCVELEGLPLKTEYMNMLCKGLSSNRSLQSLSLHNSPIGDQGCRQLCLILKNMPSVFCLDLCNCDITPKGAMEIAEILKYQSLQRFAESWKHSLRYRKPDTELMPGLRRITLNNNTLIRDEGIEYLVDILKEDVWLKAIDLQNCGISNSGALQLLEMLNVNNTLYIVDVRDNVKIHNLLLNQIMIQLYHNNIHKNLNNAEFKWTIPSSQLNKSGHSPIMNSKSLSYYKSGFGGNKTIQKLPIAKLTNNLALEFGRVVNTNAEKCISSDNLYKNDQPPTASSELQITRKKLKNVSEQLETEISLRLEAESKYLYLVSRVRKLENELLKKQREKQGFCLVREEAYEAIMDTFKKFSQLMEYIANTKDISSCGILPVNINKTNHGQNSFQEVENC